MLRDGYVCIIFSLLCWLELGALQMFAERKNDRQRAVVGLTWSPDLHPRLFGWRGAYKPSNVSPSSHRQAEFAAAEYFPGFQSHRAGQPPITSISLWNSAQSVDWGHGEISG